MVGLRIKIMTETELSWSNNNSNPICDICKGVNQNKQPEYCLYHQMEIEDKFLCIKYVMLKNVNNLN
jgi:hypothetical protein